MTLRVDPEWVVDQIHIRRPGEGQRDHQRGRCQVTGAHVRVDPPLEIPVAGEHRRGHQIALPDSANNLTREGAAVPDARRAAVADDVEPQVSQGFEQPGITQVVGHDARARRQAGLDVRRDAQAAAQCVAGKQSGGDQHGGVRGVGARSDGGDDDRAVADLDRRTVRPDTGAAVRSPRARTAKPPSATGAISVRRNEACSWESGTRSWGRFGPARLELRPSRAADRRLRSTTDRGSCRFGRAVVHGSSVRPGRRSNSGRPVSRK